MNYGKLENGVLVYAPNIITKDKITYKPAPPEVLLSEGYKLIVYTPCPDNGNTYEESYVDSGETITQSWVLIHELTPSEKRERAYETENCCEFNENMYTCDELEDLYYKYFAEDGKEDICAALKTAITAGKTYIREKYPDESEV